MNWLIKNIHIPTHELSLLLIQCHLACIRILGLGRIWYFSTQQHLPVTCWRLTAIFQQDFPFSCFLQVDSKWISPKWFTYNNMFLVCTLECWGWTVEWVAGSRKVQPNASCGMIIPTNIKANVDKCTLFLHRNKVHVEKFRWVFFLKPGP